MLVAYVDNIGGASVTETARLDAVEAFRCLLDAAEGGALDVVPALRQLVADSDAVAEAMCEADALAFRFDAVVATWTEAA